MNYKELYDNLYGLGYHSKAKNHGRKYVRWILENYKFKKMLEVGCSNGIVCTMFQNHKKNIFDTKLKLGINDLKIECNKCE